MNGTTNIDKNQAFRFLRQIDAKARAFTFQTFKEKGNKSPDVFARIIHASSLAALRQEHELGAGVYLTVNQTDGEGRAIDHIVRVRAVWEEDDEGYDGAFPLAPSMIIESSPGHFHRYWLVADTWPVDAQGRADFAAVMERMVESYGSDKSAKDISRVLRVPGFLHRKADPFMVRIVEATGRRYSRADIIAAFPRVEREQKPHKEWKPQGAEDQRIRDALNSVNADDRDLWLQCGMALKDHYGDSGRPLWDQWSRQSEKFDERDQIKTWRSFRRNGIGIGSLFHHAKQGGWKDEKKRRHDPGNTGNRNTAPAAPGERSIVAIRADTLTPVSIDWAWKNRFAFGKLTVIAGDPGLGKSTILADIAALHTKGGNFPCNEGRAIICEVAILTAEDGLRDTLVPRLMAAEADMSKIHFITGTKIGGAVGDEAMFDITTDIAALRKYFTDYPAIRVLIIDPLTAYLGAGTRAKENTEVRRVLMPLVKLIEDFNISLVVNNHLNKAGGKALYRILNSIAFVAVGRIIHVVVEDADNHDLKKFICSKINIGSKPLGLTYVIQKVWIKGEQGEEIETSRISWGTTHIDETADEALAEAGSGVKTSTDEAIEFLLLVLADGRVSVPDIEAEARAAGFLGEGNQIRQSKPFRSAKDALKIVSSRDGFGPGAVYYWSLLPTASPTMRAPMRASSKDRAHMDKQGAHDEKKEGEGADGGGGTGLHVRPQTCAPSFL